MKKHFLISLLWLIAIFVSFGSSFSFITSFSNASTNKSSSSTTSNLNNEELNTLEEYSSSDDYFNWTIEQISMGSNTSAAVVNDGTGEDGDHLYTWGKNDNGQLGLGNEKNYDTPQEVTGLPPGNIEQISMGYTHSGALVDGTLYTWGNNSKGQLGNGKEGSTNIPEAVPDGKEINNSDFRNGNIEQISMGTSFSMAVVNNDSGEGDRLYTWGINTNGELGQGTYDDHYTIPHEVTTFKNKNIKQIEGGKEFAATVITTNSGDDELYTWGDNDYGKLGYGYYNEKFYVSPKRVTDLPEGDIEQISLGYQHAGAIVENSLYTWGYNYDGQLGVGNSFDSVPSPKKVDSLPSDGNIEQISMGENVSSAIVDEQLYTWGEAQYGQLGLEVEDNQFTPQPILIPKEGSQEQVSMVSIGTSHSAAVANNKLYTWGTNNNGQLGLDDNIKRSLPELVDLNFPYLKEIKSWTTISEEESEVIISYSFKTNVDVQDVTISIANESEPDKVLYLNNSTPKQSTEPLNSDYWTGEAIFNIDTYNSYQYWIDLNYKDENGNIKIITNITEGNFDFIGDVIEPQIDKKSETEVTNIDPETASIDYVVMGGTDEYGNEVILNEVQWIDTTNSKTLAFNDNSPEMEDTLTATNLVPNHPYETKLVAVFNKGQPNEKKVESSQINFETLSACEPTIVTAGEVEVVSSTKASIYYKVDLGKNDDGEDVEITSVDWIVEGKSVASSKKIEGNLTSNNFKPNETYSNTTIEVTVSDGSTVKPFNVEEFQMDPDDTPSTIKQKEETEVEVIDPTTATVEYEVELGTDVWGEEVNILKIEWIVEGKSVVSSEESELTGKLTYDGFSPNKTYSNTTLKLTVSDYSATKVAEVNEFKMDPAEVNGPEILEAELDYGTTTAWIDYEINLGNDEYGKAYEIESVSWMDASGKNPFYDSVPVTDGKSTGKLEIEGLEPKSKIEKSLMVVTFKDDSIKNLTTEISGFRTKKLPEEKPTMNLSNGEITETSITINYVATLGIDDKGLEYKLTTIEVIDSNNNSLYIENDENGLDKNGEIIIEGLESKTTYDDLIVISTFENSKGENYEPGIETDISSFKTLKEVKLIKTWMIIVVSIITLIFIANIIRGLIYLFLKNKSAKL